MDYTNVTENFNNNIKDALDWLKQFEFIRESLGVSLWDEDGKYKDMETFYDDLSCAYITYQRKVNGLKLGRNKVE